MPIALLLYELKQEFPSFRLVPKRESWFMRVLYVLLNIITLGNNKKFMTNFATTIGTTVYTPDTWDHWDGEDKLSLLTHERVHMQQAQRYTFIGFAFLYLLVFFPVGLAYYRCKFEQEAYAATMAADADTYGFQILLREDYKEHIAAYFVSGTYGWMWPFRGQIEAWYDETRRKIHHKMMYE